MPYLKQDDRNRFWELEAALTFAFHKHSTPGELNYVITKVLQEFVTARGLCYAALNDAVGAVEAAKLEFYRRAVARYEDKKIEENGDVY
jgi:hypothetical protein